QGSPREVAAAASAAAPAPGPPPPAPPIPIWAPAPPPLPGRDDPAGLPGAPQPTTPAMNSNVAGDFLTPCSSFRSSTIARSPRTTTIRSVPRAEQTPCCWAMSRGLALGLALLSLSAGSGGTASAAPRRYAIDPASSRVLIQVGRAGVLGFAGHEHEVIAPVH